CAGVDWTNSVILQRLAGSRKSKPAMDISLALKILTRHTILEEATIMLDKAQEHLTSADLLHQHGQYRDAVSRAYYASFSAMYALVGEPPRGSWEHPGL